MEDDKYVLSGPPPTGPIPNDSFGKLLFNSLLENGDKKDTAMVDAFTGATISYEYLLEKAANLAEALRRFGCSTNTVLSISSENSLEFFIPVIASLFAGTIIAPLNPLYTSTELSHVLNIIEPKIIFVSEFLAPKFVMVKQKFSCIEKIIVINSDNQINGTKGLQEFIVEMIGKHWTHLTNFCPWNGDTEKQVAFILCSSGTTGLPKGVMITHRNIATRLAQTWHPKYCYPERSIIHAILPMFHAYGLVIGITSIINKNKLVVMNKFDEDVYLSSIEKYKINSLIIAPPLAIFLAKTPKLRYYDVSSVQRINCGAAPLSKDIEDTLLKRLNIAAVTQGYGLTEGTLASTLMENGVGRTGSCGKVIAYMKVKVRCPDTGKALGPCQTGEMCIKGPQIMKGYYKNEEATRNTFTSDGWLLTGDLGYYDNDGFFYIVDRLKELIKYKGFQVPPAELEAILINHPKVLDVGVVGLPDNEAGELPVAFVVKKVEDVTEKELQDFVAERVSPQKRLRGGVKFLSSIPKSASGKILRRELKKLLIQYKKKQKSKL